MDARAIPTSTWCDTHGVARYAPIGVCPLCLLEELHGTSSGAVVVRKRYQESPADTWGSLQWQLRLEERWRRAKGCYHEW